MKGTYSKVSKQVGTNSESMKVPSLIEVKELINRALEHMDIATFCQLMTIKRFADALNEEEAQCLDLIDSVWDQIIKAYL